MERRGSVSAAAYFTHADGRRRRIERSGRSEREARRRLTEEIERRRTYCITGNFQTTFGDVATKWLQVRRAEGELAPTTLHAYARAMDHYVLPALGGLLVTEITGAHIMDLLLDRARLPIGQVKTCRTLVRQVLAWCVSARIVTYNVAAGSLPTSRRNRRPVRTLTAAQVSIVRERLLALSARKPSRSDAVDVWDLIAVTGARISEALALRWCDIDFGDQTLVRFDGALRSIPGTGYRRSEELKSTTSRRRVAVPEATRLMLERRAERLRNGPQGAVFPTTSGFRTPPYVSAAIKEALAGTELAWVSPHILRKTVATSLFEQVGIEAASRQLGHSEVAVTMRHYIDLGDRPNLNAGALAIFAPPIGGEPNGQSSEHLSRPDNQTNVVTFPRGAVSGHRHTR
jgi:integrase